MKINRLLGLLMTPIFLFGNFSGWVGHSAPEKTADCVRVVRSGAGEIILETKVAGIQTEPVEINGQTYSNILIPRTEQGMLPGAPQLPVCGTMIGLPRDEQVKVEILGATYQEKLGYQIAPTPSLDVQVPNLDQVESGDLQVEYKFDQKIYASNSFYPKDFVEIKRNSYFRDQVVLPVQFNPVQYNPVSGQLRIYDHILVRLSWDGESDSSVSGKSTDDPAFEQVLKSSLANYNELERSETSYASSNVLNTQGYPIPASPNDTQALKITVDQDGFYKITPDDLSNQGFDFAGVDPHNFKMTNRGQEIPIFVQGEGDNQFDASDYILFYGTAITDVYTTQNVYWLTVGSTSGLRMEPKDGTPLSGTPPESFPAELHAEQDTFYWQTMPNGEGQDHWFWGDRISPNTTNIETSRVFTFTLDNISSQSAEGTVLVRFKGYTNINAMNPDHKTGITLNGTSLGDQSWDGFNVYDLVLPFDQGLLNDGVNTLAVEALDIGAPVDQYFINYFEISYQDTYLAEQNELQFGAPAAGSYRFEVNNFSNNQIQLFDISDPAHVARITNPQITLDGSSYKVVFSDNAQQSTQYLALTPDEYKQPLSIKLDTTTPFWRTPDHGADYIIITHGDLIDSAKPLADYRSSPAGGNFRVVTVNVEDLYDEFNYGIFNPKAIRNFLSYAYHEWTRPAPAYVLLLGSASYDYRNLLNLPRVNYVPTQMIETFLLGQTPSDDWFVQINGDDVLPDMFLGRMAVRNASDVTAMVNKAIAYEQNPPNTTWGYNALFVAGDDETSFVTISEDIIAGLPVSFKPTRVYLQDYPVDVSPKPDVVAAINNGSLLVNYAGHGNPETWRSLSGRSMLDIPDVENLNNTGKPTIVTAADCLSGFFVGRTNPSMAEAFMRLADKGAVAVWAPTGLGNPSGHHALLKEFYDAVFKDDIYELGEATATAKINLYADYGLYGDLLQTFLLFGDPATRIGIPTNPPYVINTLPANGAKLVHPDQPIRIEFFKRMDPTSVTLDVTGPGNLTFTPNWNDDGTIVTFSHDGFTPGGTYQVTINGQDQLGNPLVSGLVPNIWSFTVARSIIYLPLAIDNK